MRDLPFTMPALRGAYAGGARPREVLAETFRRIEAAGDPGIFIQIGERERCLGEADALGGFDPARPLWGLPFAVKDNIDVAGMDTTAACPRFAYRPRHDAFVVARLRAAGAIPIGKTNLDQFATGLVGTRTPHPVPRNAVDPALVPGGSSSGSAVAVARGLVPFALGTDTAGSGRVPAALNNLVGLKPSLGAISNGGVVPACRTLDTVSILSLTVDDAWAAFSAAAAHDPGDPWSEMVPRSALSRLPPAFRVGIPDPASIRFCDDALQAEAFVRDTAQLAAIGAELVPLDFSVLYEIASLLYEGAWVAERHTVIAPLLHSEPDAVHPVTRTIVEAAESLSADDAFRGIYRLKALSRDAQVLLAGVDMLCVPSIPTLFTCADLAADAYRPNALLGTYTNFVNLLRLCGITVPTPPRGDGRPASLTLLAAHAGDARIASVARALSADPQRLLGGTGWRAGDAGEVPLCEAPACRPEEIALAVCGAHMSGLALNHELTSRGGRFLESDLTAAEYRLHALPGTPARPGLVRVEAGGAAIALEVWALPRTALGDFVADIPGPLAIGTVRLAGGGEVKGFVCEAAGAAAGRDITTFGGWRRFIDSGAGAKA